VSAVKLPETLEEAHALILRLLEENAKLTAQVAELMGRVTELEARLGMNSSNSHKPPSTDSPFKRPPPVPPSGRKPGGQPGHKAHQRAVLPADEVVELKPCTCEHCGAALSEADLRGEPTRHQRVDIEFRQRFC
jgi:transposase